MTDQPTSTSQPSMEDILASIRKIIDDEDASPAATASTSPTASNPEMIRDSFAVDEDAAALALAEYDAAMAAQTPAAGSVDPTGEQIFPQRDGALWRRVAGHSLSEGETDPLSGDDTFELTDTLDDELELNELLDSAGESDPYADAKLLDDAAAYTPDETSGSSIGIGAMTAAGIGAAAATSTRGGLMDRLSGGTPLNDNKADNDDDILDLTRSIETGKVPSNSEDLPPPVFERVDLNPPGADRISTDGESKLDQSFETAAVTGLHGDYSAVLADGSGAGDDKERALDDRFYSADETEEDLPPEIQGTYSTGLDEGPARQRDDGAPTEDEMETVGGLVRDALRGRLPVVAQPPEDALVTGGAEESAARSLAALARYDEQAPRRIYGGIKITDDEDSPTIEGMVQDTLRPMLRDWLNDNLPTLVESMVKQEVDRISARSRRFVRDDED